MVTTTTTTMEVVAAATGNGSSPAAWKRRARRRDRTLSIYKHRYAHRNVTTFQHSVFGALLPFYSLSARYLSDASSRTTAAFTHPRDHCSPRYGFDSATGNASCDEGSERQCRIRVFFTIDPSAVTSIYRLYFFFPLSLFFSFGRRAGKIAGVLPGRIINVSNQTAHYELLILEARLSC